MFFNAFHVVATSEVIQNLMEVELLTAELCSVLYSTKIISQLLTSCVASAIYIVQMFASNFFYHTSYSSLDDIKNACIDDKITSASCLLCS